VGTQRGDTMKLFHNPRCSKSRTALKFFEENNIRIDVVQYQKEGISKQDAQKIVNNFDDDFRHLLRNNPLEDIHSDITYAEKVELLLQHVEHLQRPLLLTEDDCQIGRPLENFSTIQELSRYFTLE
jgi:arsenate reductase